MIRRALLRGLMVSVLAMLTVPAALHAQAPSNGKIVFERGGCFWVMNADGSNPTVIGNDFGADFCPGNNRDPVWSPDGTKIAFVSDKNTSLPINIYVMNADGSNVVRLIEDVVNDIDPAWSPDGTKIAFASSQGEPIQSIYTVNADGTNIVRITNALPGSDGQPTWSPDGTRIAFGTNQGGIGLHVAVVNADGTGRTDFAPNIAFGFNPAWSPDGTRIAFQGDGSVNPEQIFVMNTDGTGQTRLTTNTFHDLKPAWSPDGARIAFERNMTGQWQIFVMNADGTGQTNYSGTEWGNAPDWQSVIVATCQLTITPTFTSGTLDLGFLLANSAPATWSTWLIHSGGVVNLWSVPIPAVSPAVSFHVPIPGFPPIGYLGTLTVIGTQAGAICGDFKIVNTGF